MDVAQALGNLMGLSQLAGTVSLPGPRTLSSEYLLDLVSSVTYNPPSRSPVIPKRVALAVARGAQSVWWPLICPDEVERRYLDDVTVVGDWEAVGVVPDDIENHAITYLRRYRSAYVCSLRDVSMSLADLGCRDNFQRPVVFPTRQAMRSYPPFGNI